MVLPLALSQVVIVVLTVLRVGVNHKVHCLFLLLTGALNLACQLLKPFVGVFDALLEGHLIVGSNLSLLIKSHLRTTLLTS